MGGAQLKSHLGECIFWPSSPPSLRYDARLDGGLLALSVGDSRTAARYDLQAYVSQWQASLSPWSLSTPA